jgi:hypothetical protein
MCLRGEALLLLLCVCVCVVASKVIIDRNSYLPFCFQQLFRSFQTNTDTNFRKTKIICTIGPACWEIPQLETLMEAGLNVARLNFSHGDHVGHAATLDRVRQAARNKMRSVAIMLDTRGPEIRSGFFANNMKKIDLVKGETIVLTSVS